MICVFGDSISEGYYDSEQGGWVNLLARKLNAQSHEYELHNFSVSGYSTREVLKVFDLQTSFTEPDVIIFMLGANDSYYVDNKKSNVSPTDFEKNLIQLVRKSKRLNAKVIFISDLEVNEKLTKPVNWDKTVYYYNDFTRQYNQITEMVAKENNCTYIDIYNCLNIDKDLFDGVHPNTNGHKKLFEKIYAEIKHLL